MNAFNFARTLRFSTLALMLFSIGAQPAIVADELHISFIHREPVANSLADSISNTESLRLRGQSLRLDETRTIVFGSFVAAAGCVRSVVLLTADDGLSWREVLPPLWGHDIITMVVGMGPSRKKREVLVAVAEWAIESPGWELVFFVSTDGGQRWTRQGTLQKPHFTCVLERLVMRHPIGLVTLTDVANDDSHHSFVTNDGGRSWKPTKQLQRLLLPTNSPFTPVPPPLNGPYHLFDGELRQRSD